jgi:hypothetical protein
MGDTIWRVPGRVERSGPALRRLHRCEEKRDAAITGCARELARISPELADHWRAAIPQAIYDLLEGFDPTAAGLAARAWLRDHEQRNAALNREAFDLLVWRQATKGTVLQ